MEELNKNLSCVMQCFFFEKDYFSCFVFIVLCDNDGGGGGGGEGDMGGLSTHQCNNLHGL